jgi:glutamyl-Q tRNA(Asp) synthetase
VTFRTRFAPSPTGPLHLGHAFSALTANALAKAAQGDFLLRIEDIDQSRAQPKWEAQIYDDLAWLGLNWPSPVMRQSERLDVYRASLETMWQSGLLYACTCTRRDIAQATSAPQEGHIPMGPDGVIYPGTCREAGHTKDAGALRLNLAKAWEYLMPSIGFIEKGKAPALITVDAEEAIQNIGDIVLARRDMGTSYHLSVVLDDAAQNITHVVRGQDLFEATKIHVILQALLGLPTPSYHHHRLIRNETGKRLAKRDDARAIATYRAEGASQQDISKLVGL